MGRYYNGDIEGKFWFGIQDSRDPAHFGGKETPIFDYDPETGETIEGSEQIGSNFVFTQEDLPTLEDGIKRCLDGLGINKEKIDAFFEGRESYSDKQLEEYLELEGTEWEKQVFTKAMLMLYARLEIGNKIRDCVVEKGECNFDADFY